MEKQVLKFVVMAIFVSLALQGAEAREISDLEMAAVHGNGFSGELCGYCYDVCK